MTRSFVRWPVAIVATYFALVVRAAGASCLPDPTEHVVSPELTDPQIDQDLEDHYAYLTPGFALRGRLVVWFPGSCGQPRNQRRFLREAAANGFHVIGLSYPNCPTVNGLCDPLQPGDPNCYENVRLERVDRSPLVTVSAANGIENRLAKLLQYLAASFPAEGWSAYLASGVPVWPAFVVAGHSQGGGMAAILGKEHEVARVAMLSWKDTISPLEPAPWLFEPKQTPPDRYFGFSHQHSSPIPEEVAWDALGLPGDTVDVDSVGEPFGNANRLTTDKPDQDGGYGDAHGSVVTDGKTPLRADGTPLHAEVWRYLIGATPPSVVPIRTTRLTMRDGVEAGDPERRKVGFQAVTRSDAPSQQIVAPAPGTRGDPTVSGDAGGGALLKVFNAQAGGEIAAVPLPAAGWRTLGSPAKPKGYVFRDSSPSACVQTVVVKDNRLTIRGGGAAWCYSLDEPAQGGIGLRLTLGQGVEWCSDAPANASGNPPSSSSHDQVDEFTAEPGTPAPAACPLPPRPPLPDS